jgi:tetratricopeptide (TPR) repeat protein
MNWKGSLIEETVSIQLAAAGHDVVDVERRNDSLAEWGFEPGESVSRATALLIAEELAADRLVIGSFGAIDGSLHVSASLIDVGDGSTKGVLSDHAPEGRLTSLANQIAKNFFRLEGDDVPVSFDTSTMRRVALPLGALQASARARLIVDFEGQKAQLERALGMAPEYAEAKHVLGRRLLHEGEVRRAIEILVDASTDAAFHPSAYFDLGCAYLAIEENESAESVFRSLSEMHPSAAAYQNNHGVALMRLGQVEDALEAFRKAHGLRPEESVYTFNSGWAHWRAGKGRQALELFEEVTKINPVDLQAFLLLSAATASQADSDRAEAVRTATLLLAPHLADVDPATVSGWSRPVLDERRGLPVAPSLTDDTEHVASLSVLLDAREFHRLGKTDEAIQTLRRGVYEEPSALELRRELAELLREQGKLSQAASELAIVVWSDPTVDTHVQLARLFVALDDHEKASEHLEAALALDPEHEEAQELHVSLSPMQ